MMRPSANTRLARTRISLCLVALSVAILIGHQASAQHRIFVTSSTGTADLGSWPEADGEVGLRAADAICRAHAAAGNVPNPQSFVAWMSDSADDAYCRIHGLTGKKADNCGQAIRPTNAGPWVRMDDFPFGGPIEDILSPSKAVLAPVDFSESGARVFNTYYFTGTTSAGKANGPDSLCEEWTSSTDASFVTLGNSQATGRYWTGAAATFCASPRPLLCMQAGSGPPLPDYEQTGGASFVTVDSRPGNLSEWPGANGNIGVAAGDAICRREAEIFDLPNADSFRAWLSDSTSDARSRLESDGPWVRPDGVPVATSKADLLDGSLFAPINLRLDGLYLDNNSTWTGTATSGTATGNDCDDWSASALEEVANTGTAGYASAFWSPFPGTSTCTSARRLICLEDSIQAESCIPSANTLCMGDGNRFAATITWETDNENGSGQAVDIGRVDSGLFTFFDPNNLELLLKVLDGCALTDHFWVFYGATTDVGFELVVTDTQTGTERIYRNSRGVSAQPVKDFFAFPCSGGS